MDESARDALRERNRRRTGCTKCGAMSVEVLDGAQLDSTSHFAGMKYKCCRACGHEEVKKR